MSHHIQPTPIDNITTHLTPAEISDPVPVIEELFDEYSIEEHRARLDQIIDISLCSDGFNDPTKRAKLIVWYKMTIRALEGLYTWMSIKNLDTTLQD